MSRSAAPEIPACRELSLGAHIVTARGGYVHHGIYVGNGLVVHYGGLVGGLRAGPIEARTLYRSSPTRIRRYYELSDDSSLHVWYGEPRNWMLRIEGRY
jgi:Lecithin retinol acyltransferase